jgi:transcriptional regulator with XRE-family HTH domain
MNGWNVPEFEPVLPMVTGTPLGRRLRDARLGAGLTGPGVLARTGIDPGNLSRMEHGRRVPSVAILVTLAKLYRVSLSALFEAAAGTDPAGPESLSPGLQLADYVAAPEPGFRELHERHWNDRPDLRDNARRFANDVFEPVRAILGVPLRVESGYRSPALDRKVLRGQAPFSAHTHGLAADVTPVGMSIQAALPLIRAAVQRGNLEHLDFVGIEKSQWLHLQAAPEAQAARRIIASAGAC